MIGQDRYVYLIRKSRSERTNPKEYNTIKDARVGALRSYKQGPSPWIEIYKVKLRWDEDMGKGLYLAHMKPCEILSYDGNTRKYIISLKTNTPNPTYVVNKDGSLGKRLH